MDEKAQSSPKIVSPVEGVDAKYIAKLSTILVATIQEAKDRISQIEYVFCSQLFPNFQLTSKSVQQILMEAKEAAEASWKEKEHELLLQMERTRVAKQQILEENLALKSQNAKLMDGAFEWKKHFKELSKLRSEYEELNKLCDSKDSQIRKYEEKLKELENKNILLSETHQNLELEVQGLQIELKNKSREIDGDLELQHKLVQIAQEKTTSVAYKESQLRKYEEKIEKLLAEHEEEQRKIGKLQDELTEKNNAMEKSLEVQENLVKKLQSKELENEQIHSEKKLFVQKIKNLEICVDKLQVELEEGKKSQEQLLKQIDFYSQERSKTGKNIEELEKIKAKDSELLSAKRKMKEISHAYKSLKSQYNFVCAKAGLTPENMKTKTKLEEESDPSHNQTPPNKNNVETEVPKPKSCLPAGTKRRGSYWRDTRSHQSRVGPDPHDDFLDTPLENARRGSGNGMKEVEEAMDSGNSDDETQDMNIDKKSPQKQQGPGFKYIESVRKKSEREKLKGVECKQCKKFYDVVLPSEGANSHNLRCEHHDGVSRHRYRYVPPSTPEGFWNIGFDTEL